MESDEHEWELSKENVQPLRQGRHMPALVAALHSHQGDGEEQLAIRSKQNEFEMELREYTGDDPLSVWDSYIKWIEQYYPKGGHEGQLMRLIEQCLKLFQNDPRYANDPRFFQVWLKFIHLGEDPVEVFMYMFDKGICSSIAQFYIEWAIAIEKTGDLKSAEATYLEGFNRCPQSKDILAPAHSQFTYRLAQNITLQIEESRAAAMFGGEGKEKRSALSRLRTHGNQARVGVTRTGDAKLGLAGTLGSSQPAPPKQQIPRKKFQVFCDENAAPSLRPQQTGEWQSIPVRAETNRENEMKPAAWTDVKMKQRPTGSDTAQRAPFQIHEDPEDACGSSQLQAPKTTLINSQPLSARKNPCNPDVLGTLRHPAFTPNTGTPMYQKDNIYQGLMEFSFEELRANRYWKRRQEIERQKSEAERKQREEWVRMQLEEKEAKIAALEAALQQARLSQPSGAEGENEAGSTSTFSTPTYQMIHSTSQGFSNGSFQSSSAHLMESSNTNKDSSGSGARQSNVPAPTPPSTSSTGLATSGDLSDQRHFGTGSSAGPTPEGSLSAPSPTVHTKEAYKDILGMFNSTISQDSFIEPISSGKTPLKSPVPIAEGGFPVYQDGMETEFSSASKGCFPLYEDRMETDASTALEAQGGFPIYVDRMETNASTAPKAQAGFPIKEGMETGFSSARKPQKGFLMYDRMETDASTAPKAQGGFLVYEDGMKTDSSPALKPQGGFPIYEMETDASAFQKTQGGFSIYEEKKGNAMSATGTASFRIHKDAASGFEIDEDNGYGGAASHFKDDNVNISKPNWLVTQMALRQSDSQNKENEQDKSNGSRGSTSRSKGLGAQNSARKMGVVFNQASFQDESVGPALQGKEKSQGVEGFTIRYEELHNESSRPRSGSVKQSSRRGLAFSSPQSSAAGGEATAADLMPDEFTIECQAKHEETLAPLEHFTQHARAASTPFAGGQNSSVGSLLCEQQSQESTNILTATAPSASTNISGSLATPCKDLSPILEGSNEESNEDVKSLQSNAALTSQVAVDPLQEVEDDGNVSMQDDHDEDRQLGRLESTGELDKLGHPQIDTTAYIPEENEDGTEALLADPMNPFDDATVDHILASLDRPLQEYPNFFRRKGHLPECEADFPFDNSTTFDVRIGEGGCAQVWKVLRYHDLADLSALPLEKALKIQKSGGQWEFYITSTLQQRLTQLNGAVDVRPAIMDIEKAYFYDNGSALEMDYVNGGSILNLVNLYRQNTRLRENVEPFACLLTIELLHLFEQMHACHIIHGDVKPDNFLVMELPHIPVAGSPPQALSSKLQLVKLIDFGQSIDMTKFPAGTSFTAKVETSGFQCIEMKTERPWNYQTDLFGLAGTIHVVLFGSYMNVFQEDGVWRTTGNFVRKWNTSLWKRLFRELLNIPSCQQQPDLAALRTEFERHFVSNLCKDFYTWARLLRLDLNSS